MRHQYKGDWISSSTQTPFGLFLSAKQWQENWGYSHPICHSSLSTVCTPYSHTISLIIEGLKGFCDENLYSKGLHYYPALHFSVLKNSAKEKKLLSLRVSWPKLLTLTPYPKVSYTYKYTYIDEYIYIYNFQTVTKIFIFVLLCCSMLSCIHVLYSIHQDYWKREEYALYFG